MPGNYQEMSLDNINGGQLIALFEREMARVLANIADENTSVKTAREITLKIKLRPDETRETLSVEIDSHARLAPVKTSKGYAVMSFDGDCVRVFQSDPKQLGLGMDEKPENVTPMNRAASGGGS